MWSKRARLPRPTPQEPESPRYGQDSTYGVRSVSEWGGDSGLVGASLSSPAPEQGESTSEARFDEPISTISADDKPAERGSPAEETTGELQDSPFLSSPGDNDTNSHESEDRGDSIEQHPPMSASPSIATDRLLPSPSIRVATPPSPEETIHPLATPPPPSPALLYPSAFSPSDAQYPYSSDAETDTSSLALSLSSLPGLGGDLHPSEPSSPASFTSMPSYVASVSSMSRNSSPLGSAVDVPGSSRRMRHAMGEGMGVGLASLVASRTEDGEVGSGDMVLPTLSLPSSSLHLTLPRWNGERSGLRVALVTPDKGHTRSIIRNLENRGERVVALGSSGVGIVRDGTLAITLITDHSPDQIAARLRQSYTSLHALLNPATPHSAEESLNGLIEGYIAKSDWIHSTLIFDASVSEVVTNTLKTLCHCTFPQSSSELSPARSTASSPAALPPITSPLSLDGPTPMPGATEPTSYFGPPLPSIDSPPEGTSSEATAILQLIHDTPTVTQESIRKFLEWRPAPLDSSNSSLDTAPSAASASASGEASGSGASHSHPIPTVARASGSGEWEANLSRRIAKRKEGESGSSAARLRGRRTRRRSGQSADRGAGVRKHEMPLFPRRLSGGAGRAGGMSATTLGLSGLVEKTFRPLREALETKWGKVAVVALAVAVGLGFWASSRR